MSFSQDLGRHIKSGQLILETGRVASVNQFSYTYPDYPFINHHWLFQVITALAYSTVGIDTLLWVKIIILLTASFLTLKIIPQEKQVWILSLGFLFFHILRERTELRPEIFSFLFTSLTLYILFKFYYQFKFEKANTKNETISNDKNHKFKIFRQFPKEIGRVISKLRTCFARPCDASVFGFRALYMLPLIELVWTNTHIYFPIGLILQGIFLGTFLIKKEYQATKTLTLSLTLSIFVTLSNPNFLSGALYPFKIFSNYGYTIAENQTIFLLESLGFANPNFLFVKLAFGILVVTAIYCLFKKKFDILLIKTDRSQALLSLIGLGSAFALLNTRSFPYLVLVSFPALVRLLPSLKVNSWSVMVNVLVAVTLLGESLFYLNGDYYRYKDEGVKVELKAEQPGKPALDFILENKLPQLIFNNFDIGSYITYRAYPEYKVFVDGRPEVYPSDFFKQTYIPMQEDPKKFISETSKRGIKTVIFSITDQTPWAGQFFKNMNQNADWKMVYLDDAIVVYVKSSEVKRLGLKTIDLNNLKAGDYMYEDSLSYLKISYFLLNIGEFEKAQEFDQKALSLFKDSPMGNMIMVQLLSQEATNSSQVNRSDIDRYYLNSKSSFWW